MNLRGRTYLKQLHLPFLQNFYYIPKLQNLVADKGNTYFRQLTGLRAIAAYMVFTCHYIYVYQNRLPGTLYAMLGETHVGVTVFFVLSGFLIAHRYLDKVERSAKWLWQYMVNRVARIYPMYFLVTTFTFICFYFAPSLMEEGQVKEVSPFSVYLLNITFLRGFFNDFRFTGVGQGWSLTVEECFYVLAPAIFLLRKKIKLWLMPVLFVSIATILLLIFKNVNFYGFFHTAFFVYYYTFFGRCIEFFIGIQIAITLKKRAYIAHAGWWYTFVGTLGITLCLYAYTFFKYSETDLHIVFYRTVLNNIFCAVSVGLLLYGLLTEQTALRRMLSTSIFKTLGKSSYIFYLIHLGVPFELLASIFAPSWYKMSLMFVILNIIAVLLYRFVEQPLNIYLRTHLSPRKDSKPLRTTRMPHLTIIPTATASSAH